MFAFRKHSFCLSTSNPTGFIRNFTSRHPINLATISPNHAALYRESIRDPSQFWGELGHKRLRWMKRFSKVMDCNMTEGQFRWFMGGKLNAADNCLDRHAEHDPSRVALIWEKDEPGQQEQLTYRQLLDKTCQIANLLKKQGVRKGDRVTIYMTVSPLMCAAMLACARIGAIHSVVFAGFSAQSLRNRIVDAGSKVVITSDEAMRGGKVVPLKAIVDEALKGSPSVEKVFVATRTDADIPRYRRDIMLKEAMEAESTECPAVPMDSEDPLFMIHTSGSTGKAKGIIHATAGYLLYSSVTFQYVLDYRPGDISACVADLGWIAAHSYSLYAPLCIGGTSVLFESVPNYPNPGRYWEMVERLKVTHLYTSPTALRLLIKAGDHWVKQYDRSTLRVLGCAGEPLNDEAWLWYDNVVGEGRGTVVDTWWQTETSGSLLAPWPAQVNTKPKPGFPGKPFWGIEPVLLSEDGKVLEGNNVHGNLCFKTPWPGIARTIHGDHKKFLETYFTPFPGYYFSGDGAYRDAEGNYQITGRVDDVINTKGHRVGTAELESCLDHDHRVAESAVVGYPHDMFGEGIYAYVVLKDGVSEPADHVITALKAQVKTEIGSFAVPQCILVVPGLPKTRSGKIMRRILRKIASNRPDELGDVTTLADPSVVDLIVKKHAELKP